MWSMVLAQVSGFRFQDSGRFFQALLLLLAVSLSASAQMRQSDELLLPGTAEASGVVVRASSEAEAREVLFLTLKMHAKVCEMLCLTSKPPSAISWYTDTNAWKNFSRQSDARIEGKGLSGGSTIAILSDNSDAHESLAHELVHHVLKHSSPAPLPLWYEEGCAASYGWCTAKWLGQMEGRNLIRTQPALPKSELLAFEVLLGCKDYPALATANAAYSRQSEELVRFLETRLGPANFQKLGRLLAGDQNLHNCLMDNFNFSEEDWDVLKRAVYVRSTTKQER